MSKTSDRSTLGGWLSSPISILIIIFAVTIAYVFTVPSSTQPPVPLEDHPYVVLHDIWTPEVADNQMELVKSSTPFRSAADDRGSAIEEIGEWQPLTADGKCNNKLMVPNKNRTGCVIPNRADVAWHYLKTGGFAGIKERYESLISRMLSFIGFAYDQLETESFQMMFGSKQFLEGAAKVCEGKTVFHPMQLSFVVQLPGQQVPMHLDVSWFVGATRFSMPQWLTIVMQRSGLFDDIRVPQAQGVAYIHRWNASDPERGGGFYLYPQGPAGEPVIVPPEFNTAILVDGSKVIHGTTPYLKNRAPPKFKKDDDRSIEYIGDDRWQVNVNGKATMEYVTDDLRIALVWRALCFDSEKEREEYKSKKLLDVSEVVDKVVADMHAKGILNEKRSEIPAFDLGMKMIKHYPNYPVRSVNYCMLPQIAPRFLEPIARVIISPFC